MILAKSGGECAAPIFLLFILIRLSLFIDDNSALFIKLLNLLDNQKRLVDVSKFRLRVTVLSEREFSLKK